MIQGAIPSNYLLEALHSAGYDPGILRDITTVGGGSINRAYHISTSTTDYFVKANSKERYPGMFDAESRGLQALRDTGAIRIPEVYLLEHEAEDSFLIMEYIAEAPKADDFWEVFGRRLAQLHRHTADYFGLNHNNYIGSLLQHNEPASDWISFLVEQRLEPQLRMAESQISSGDRRRFERLFHRLEKLLPQEPPALLHGDLWGGNYLVDEQGNPVLIDPAIYYGHREVDLAMMHLFGGFNTSLFNHYHEEFPLEQDWQGRLDLHNLYPLLVHLNLFGSSYLSGIRNTLDRYV